MRCPKCYSDNVQLHVEKDKQGYSLGKGCCGFIFLGGPLGLLCGLCGKDNVVSEDEYWICNGCGAKFTSSNSGDVEFNFRQNIKNFEKDKFGNPNSAEYVEKQKYARDVISQNISQETREKFIFFEPENIDERIYGLIKTYEPVCDVDFSKEFIYFIYSEGNFLGEDGIIVSSKGIHHRALPTYKLTRASNIEKVSVEEDYILLNDKVKLSFEKLSNEKDRQVIVEMLNKLFIREKTFTEAKSNATGYANHIVKGGVAEADGRIYYVRKTPNNVALVENDNGNETVVYGNSASSLHVDGQNLYFLNEVGTVCKMDIVTRETIYLCQDACEELFLHNDKLYLTNGTHKKSLFSMDKDGGNCALITSDKSACIFVINDRIYYINQSDKNSIYRVSTDGKIKEKLYGEIKCNKIVTDGEYIYFTSDQFKDFHALYRIDMNGENMQALNMQADEINITESRIYLVYDNILYSVNKSDIETRYKILDYSEISNVHIVNGRIYYCEQKKGLGLHNHVTHRVDCEGGACEKL